MLRFLSNYFVLDARRTLQQQIIMFFVFSPRAGPYGNRRYSFFKIIAARKALQKLQTEIFQNFRRPQDPAKQAHRDVPPFKIF